MTCWRVFDHPAILQGPPLRWSTGIMDRRTGCTCLESIEACCRPQRSKCLFDMITMSAVLLALAVLTGQRKTKAAPGYEHDDNGQPSGKIFFLNKVRRCFQNDGMDTA